MTTDRTVIDRPSSSSPSTTRKKPTNRFGVRAEKIPTLFKNYIFSILSTFFLVLSFHHRIASLSRLQPYSLTYSLARYSRFPSRTLMEVLLGPMRPSVAGGRVDVPAEMRRDETNEKEKKGYYSLEKEV